ncbi:hypothetical protein C8R45DRAFT_485570 [Mycena sanguinolenta]|nr:hypothetical protein C8R45DRAFT_485570 [Mycena sanguinolenta]
MPCTTRFWISPLTFLRSIIASSTPMPLSISTPSLSETPILPQLYTVVSYVWFGLKAEPPELEQDGSFSVFCGAHNDGTPRENGGPISLKVLEYACRWASESSSSDLWLDRLCIMQTSKTDKAWQISRMYDIYESSEQCVVLPGGLQRLASMSDQTEWADRAWTYQEAIVTWDYAIVLTRDWYRPKAEQHWLVDGECHWQYLHQLFVEGEGILANEGLCLILGRNAKSLNMLRRIIEYKTWNHLADEGEETINAQTIRQLTLHGVAMRRSSRPVDMVLSILGSLDVREAFEDRVGDFKENERFRATLALVEALLRLDDDDGTDSTTSNSLVDVPLWQSLELTVPSQREGRESRELAVYLDIPNYPTLRDLGQLLDGDLTQIQISFNPPVLLKREPLREWAFDVDQVEDDSSVKAQAIVQVITSDALLNAYHGDKSRVLVRHAEEGVIELCRKLDMTSDTELDVNLVVFGWSLRLDRHPYIRFYKFDISQLFL